MQSLHIIVYVLIIFSIVSALQNKVKDQETIATEKRVRRAGYTYVYQYNNHYGIKKCIPPGAPNHGYSYFQSTNIGSVVIHSCKPGYALVGARVRICKHTGYWKPHLPKCSSSTCKDPGTLLNGYRFLSSTTVKSIVKYKCKPGYYLIGSSYQVCLANGKWSGVFPKCLGTGCRQLSNPANGRVKISNRTVGGVATYFCNSGFKLIGAKTRVCQSGGKWSGIAPSCQESSCGNLANPQNGKVTFRSTNVGATAHYSCNSGYILVGNRVRTCQNNKKWSGTAPVCKPLSCGHLDSPKDGKVIISGTTPGSVATYSCNPGFILVGLFKRTCQISGKWSGNAPTCKPINCENLSPPSNGFIIFSSSSPATQRPGDKATYSCSKGFRLVGDSRVRVCQQDGRYSGQAPRCQSISCGNLRDPPNGQVKLTGSFVGDKATYTCNRGFILDGNQLRTCQSTGSWSGQEPICRPVDCGDLSNPQNGRVIVTTTRLGGIAKYSCNDGFKLVGNVVRRCLASGEWSNEAPTCKANNCGQLLNPQNGHVRLSGTTIGSTATYICNRGFQLVGQRQRVCQQNTQWSGQIPRCESVSCEILQDPENGRVTVLGTLPGSVAQYSCNAGFRLVGLKTRVCGQDGSFSGQAPSCKPIFCEPLNDPENGQVTVSNNQPGSIATYSCNPGFRLIGQKSRVCQNDGTFTGQAPVCRLIDCGPLSNIANGRVEFSSTTFGSVANYFCDSGYNIVGNRQRTCQQSGQWSGEEPRCKIIDCGPLPAPQNGNVDFSSTTFLSKATYSCQNGFDLIGTRTRVCQANGQWSDNAPVCQPISCERLNNPDNGIVVVKGNTIGAVATYHCNPGFQLVGSEQRICQEDGTYSGVAPFCRVIDCGPLGNPENGIVKFGGTIIGSTATYACNKGFTLIGDSNRICQPSGDWSGREPTCSIIQCQELVAPANGEISFSSTDFGAIATYSCKFGFILVGVKTRTCQLNGEWSETSPFCRPIDCGPLDFPVNGIVRVDSTTVGSVAFYSCHPGFQLIGQERRTCQENGEWSGTKPECQSIDCGQLEEPEYGKVTITGTTTGSVATYSCNKGFKLIGTVNRICLASGQWSRTAPTCQPEDCGGLDDPANGKVVVSGTAFWDTATYSCDSPGYELVGEPVRTCQDNAQWSGVAPICQSVDCGFLDSPKNGRISFMGTTINSVATYRCFPGYQLVGKATRTCEQNGQWSGLAPFCKAVDCGTLQHPENGKVILTGTEVFSTANYQCDKGFGLVGISTRVCQPDGTWSGSAPICEPSDCGELDSPLNGLVETSGTKYWDTATYSCISGYSLVGESSRTCLDTGVWSGQAPVCVAVDCGKLNPPQYGLVDFQSTSFKSLATYSCFSGFQLIGEHTRICQADGQWSGEVPICQSVICDNIFAPENGQLHVSQGNLVNSIATYSCNPGYQLQGNTERTCQSNGKWTGFDPTCVAVDCRDIPDIIYGQVSLSGTIVGSTATYSCDAGFKLFGPSIRECLPNGLWSGVEPTCEPGGCGPLLSPVNGDVTLTGTEVGDTATYKCNFGFILEGDRFRVCESSGDWSGQAPSCKALDCGPLQSPVNGRVVIKGTAVSATATYTCDPGFVLIGNAQRECLPSGQWSGQDPTCKAVDCGPLRQPENGDVRVSSTIFGSSARYSCFPGYNLIGLIVRVCQIDGTWSGQEPTCEAGQCPNLPNPSNGIVTLSGRNLGSTATYKCNDGYELIGEDKRTCQSDATWSGREPSCRIVDCGQLFAPDNGRVEFSSTFYGSVATYSCSFDFKLIGTASRTCQRNGFWSGDEPLCEKTVIDCGPLHNPRNGEVLLSGTSSGDTATYTCFVGFGIVGVDIRFCRDDGTWSDEEPQCRPVDCGPLEPPENGNIRFIGNGFGSIARYSCFPGYKLIGDVSRTCKSDGYWSGAAPVCISDSSTSLPPTPPSQTCGDPGTPANGVKIGSDYSVGSVVYYECEPGFKLVGTKSRLCRFDGHWSEDLPTCVGNGQCVGNDKSEDDCGQVCTCENGHLVNCCRLRHDFASLDDKEKETYINAVTSIATDPVYKIKYEALLEKYKNSFDTVAQGTDPNTSQFLVWNRFFLLEYENLLREIDCHITIPYYDWTVLHTNPYIHPIWDDEKGFGKSSNENDQCVTTGPFNYNNYHLIPSAGGGCLKREYNNRKFPSRALIERDVLTHPASEFEGFHRSLQLFIHINIRCFVGGTMCTFDAANDPVFILHLSMIDYIYSRWQGFDEQRLKARYYEDSSALALAEGFTVNQFYDNSDLPNGVAVCYAEPRVKNHVPPSLYFLAQSFQESSNRGNIYMTCISKEKLDKIGQHFSDEDKEFFRKKCDIY